MENVWKKNIALISFAVFTLVLFGLYLIFEKHLVENISDETVIILKTSTRHCAVQPCDLLSVSISSKVNPATHHLYLLLWILFNKIWFVLQLYNNTFIASPLPCHSNCHIYTLKWWSHRARLVYLLVLTIQELQRWVSLGGGGTGKWMVNGLDLYNAFQANNNIQDRIHGSRSENHSHTHTQVKEPQPPLVLAIRCLTERKKNLLNFYFIRRLIWPCYRSVRMTTLMTILVAVFVIVVKRGCSPLVSCVTLRTLSVLQIWSS